MDKLVSGAITKRVEKKKRVRPSTVGASTSRHPSLSGRVLDVDLLKNILPGSRKRKEPSEMDNPSRKTTTEPICTSIQQPSAFATHKDPSVQSSYLLSMFPGNEADRWGGDSKLRAQFCLRHFAELSSGLASYFHEAIAGEAPSPAEHHEVKRAYNAEAIRAKALETELKAAKLEMARQAGKIKAQASEIARHQSELDALRTELEVTAQEAAAKGTHGGFFSSQYGVRFLEAYREELLTLYHDSMPFLDELKPAVIQYLFLGASRALEQARATGKLDGYNETELLMNLPNPDGWDGNPELPLTHPWWEPALENTVQILEEEDQAADAKNNVGEENAVMDMADTNAELDKAVSQTEVGAQTNDSAQTEEMASLSQDPPM